MFGGFQIQETFVNCGIEEQTLEGMGKISQVFTHHNPSIHTLFYKKFNIF